jgi:hypothetical protein
MNPSNGPRRVIDALLLAKVADRMYHARAMIIKKMVYMDGNVVTATGATT